MSQYCSDKKIQRGNFGGGQVPLLPFPTPLYTLTVKTARNVVSRFSGKSLKLLLQKVIYFKAKMHQIRCWVPDPAVVETYSTSMPPSWISGA